jgi:hypothetical protein
MSIFIIPGRAYAPEGVVESFHVQGRNSSIEKKYLLSISYRNFETLIIAQLL